jgi:hypothetical protein
MAIAGENAHRGEPARKITSVRSASRRAMVPCNVDVTGEDWRDCNAPFGDPGRRAQGCPPNGPHLQGRVTRSHPLRGKVGQLGAAPSPLRTYRKQRRGASASCFVVSRWAVHTLDGDFVEAEIYAHDRAVMHHVIEDEASNDGSARHRENRCATLQQRPCGAISTSVRLQAAICWRSFTQHPRPNRIKK